MPKITATADLHGTLPEVPQCDLLVVAGDLCPTWNHSESFQTKWLCEKFAPWINTAPAKYAVCIAGNHDFALQDPNAVHEFVLALDTTRNYLQDQGISIPELGLSLYGTPWTGNLPHWAFQAEDNDAEELFSSIPLGLDILISHGPPFGYGDRVSVSHVGSSELLHEVKKKSPRYVICGHIHEGYGYYYETKSNTHIYCVSHKDRYYDPVNELVEIEV